MHCALSAFTGASQLTSGMLSITLMGHITLLAGTASHDFNLTRPQGGFRLVRHPDSGRATLVQLGNEAQAAFRTAEVNMYAVQARVRSHVETIR